MALVRVSGTSQRLFAELCSEGGAVNAISSLFRSEGFEPPPDWEWAESGVRRDTVDAYHSTIDLADEEQVTRLLRVYDTGLEEFGSHWHEGEMQPTRRAIAFLRSLERDGVRVENDRIVFRGADAVYFPLAEYGLLTPPAKAAIQEHLDRIGRGLREDPAAAVTASKDLLETVCKVILSSGPGYKRRDDLPALYKAVAGELQLKAESVDDSSKGSAAAQQALRSLVTCVQSLSELRNQLAAGHGRESSSPARSRHAELAFNSSRTVAEFLLQTWHVRAGAPGFESMR